MKKALIIILVVAIMAASLIFTVSAANYEHIADDLHALGLFRGTDNGYELDRAPNRGEGLVMLIRLLGLETDALACESESPFTDVPGWLAPYVAYAYENGLTNGTTATTYSPGSLCNAQMYVTFILRALGYSDSEDGDFTYAGALDFGKAVGIIDEGLANGDFLRDQMVAVSYLALLAPPNGGDFDSLLEKLVADGAVAQDIANALLGKWALLDELASIGPGIAEDRIAMNIKLDTDMGALGAMMAAMGMDATISMDMDISMIMEDEDVLAAITMAINTMGDEQTVVMYIADGYTYMDDGNSKTKVANAAAGEGEDSSAISDPTGIVGVTSIIDVSQISSATLMISEISKSAEGDNTVYTVKIADGFIDSLMGQAIGLADEMGLDDTVLDGSDISMSISSMKLYLDSAGALKKIAIVIDMKMPIDMGGVTMPANIKINLAIAVIATGDDVTVVLPADLDEYVLTSADSTPLG